MKKIFIIMLLLIASCAPVRPFDTTEFYALAKLQTEVKLLKDRCEERPFAYPENLVREAKILYAYSLYISEPEIYKSIHDFVMEFANNSHQMSLGYCRIKLSTLDKSIDATMKTMAKRELQ